jgi:hypothetical protein
MKHIVAMSKRVPSQAAIDPVGKLTTLLGNLLNIGIPTPLMNWAVNSTSGWYGIQGKGSWVPGAPQ